MIRRVLYRVPFALLVLLAASRADEGAAKQRSAKTVRLLTVGNSFSNNATHYLEDLAKAAGHTLIHHRAAIGGGTMAQHWEKAQQHEQDPRDPRGLYTTKLSLKQELLAEPWDYITIQQASIRSHDVETYRPYAQQLHDYLHRHAPQAEILVHQTWAYRVDDPRFSVAKPAPGEPATQAEMYRGLNQAYATIAQELKARRIPVGDAFHSADTDAKWGYRPDATFDVNTARYPALPDQTHSLHVGWRWAKQGDGAYRLGMDGHHANTAGEYLGACVFYEVLFGEASVGNPFVPAGVDPAYAKFLQETAHRVVGQQSAKAVVPAKKRPNVLFIISDDLTSTALSCYGNTVCRTPNIDRLAAQGTRFTRAYCQGTYCGPSRASFMSGYYPHATGVLGYTSPRPAIGDRATWSQHFKNAGYYTARVSKIYHMGVPGGIEDGGDGPDDPASWTERFNSPGPEWKAPGNGETLEGNPDGKRPVVGGNTFVVVEADGDDSVHSDGKTAAKAVELIEKHAGEPFFLAVGFVRPHVPFVSPKRYFEPFLPYDNLALPPKVENDWSDIPKAGINYKTSLNMRMDARRQQKALGGYYAAVSYMDAQVGKVLTALEKSAARDNTIVIFTSDHGYHLGEHDFWAKVSLHEESAKVPLIICVPGKQPAVCDSLTELLDLYPTVASLCGLEAPSRLQGKDISAVFDDPSRMLRQTAFSVSPSQKGFLLREDKWAYIQYAEDASQGIELFDMINDPKQYTNLAAKPELAAVVHDFKTKLAAKLHQVRDNDLGR